MRCLLSVLLLVASLSVVARGQLNIISTVAGGGPNAPSALAAEIVWPAGVAIDKQGNTYVCATTLNEILKIDGLGQVTVVAGKGYAGYSGDGGLATNATLDLSGIYIGTTPAIALDASGNLFIADTVNNVIRRVDATTATITTVAGNGTNGYSGDGGPATSASLSFPGGIALDASGDLYIADGNSVIRRVDAATGIITTVAGNHNLNCIYTGDGRAATSAGLCSPAGVGLDGSGNLFIADTYDNVVRRVDASSGIIATVAGKYSIGYSYLGDGGPATQAGLNTPSCVTVDASGNLFIGDANNEVIRRVDAKSGLITTVAGNGPGTAGLGGGFSGDGGPATSAQLNLGEFYLSVTSIAVDASGDLFIPDTYNNRVRKVDGKTHIITTFAGGGSGGDGGLDANGILALPLSLAVDPSGDLFIDDFDAGRIRRVEAATGIISTVAGNGRYVCCSLSTGIPAATTGLHLPIGLAADSSGNVFISDTNAGRVRRVDAVTGVISTVAGGGPGGLGDGGPATSATLNQPHGIAIDAAGNLFIGDTANSRVRRVDAMTTIISTVAGDGTFGYSGDGGLATQAKLNRPQGVAVDRTGNLFIADASNGRIRRVDAAGMITTVAGNGSTYRGDGGPATKAGIGFANAIALDSLGNLFLGEPTTQRVRRVDAFTGIITTVAGNGTTGFRGDGGPASRAEFDEPAGIAVDHLGNLFIADGANNRVRKVLLPPFEVLSTTNVTFPTQVVGTRSRPQVLTLLNTGTGPLSIFSLAIVGANAGDFAQTNYCGSSVASGERCSILVTFAPGGVGKRTATLTVTDNAPDSPRTVTLSGTGCRAPCLIFRPL